MSDGRRERVEAQAALRPLAGAQSDQARPHEREEQHPFRAERLGHRAGELAEAPDPQLRDSHGRGVGAQEPLDRPPLAPRHARGAADLEHGRELQQAADVGEVVQTPHPHALRERRLIPDPLAQRRHPVGRGVPERGARVLDVVVERTVDELDLPERARHEPDPVIVEVGELSAAGTGARSRAPRAAAARPRR